MNVLSYWFGTTWGWVIKLVISHLMTSLQQLMTCLNQKTMLQKTAILTWILQKGYQASTNICNGYKIKKREKKRRRGKHGLPLL